MKENHYALLCFLPLFILGACTKKDDEKNGVTPGSCMVTLSKITSADNRPQITEIEYDSKGRISSYLFPILLIATEWNSDTIRTVDTIKQFSTYNYIGNSVVVKSYDRYLVAKKDSEVVSRGRTLKLNDKGQVVQDKDDVLTYNTDGYLVEITKSNGNKITGTYVDGNLITETYFTDDVARYKINYVYFSDKIDTYRINALLLVSDLFSYSRFNGIYGKASKNALKGYTYTVSFPNETESYLIEYLVYTPEKPIKCRKTKNGFGGVSEFHELTYSNCR